MEKENRLYKIRLLGYGEQIIHAPVEASGWYRLIVDQNGVWRAVHEKWGQSNVGWRNHTCWTVRRSHLERPDRAYRLAPPVQETMTAREYAERP